MLSNLSRRSAIAVPRRQVRPVQEAPPALAFAKETEVKITATILTKNSAKRLADVLAALRWCDEVVVLDTGSTDETLEIARRYANVNVRELVGLFPGFGRAHRQAVALSRNDWILSIDSDEVLTEGLSRELMRLKPCPRTVYAIPFHNYFNGRLITSCGWYPERHERLFNRRATNFCENDVHERVQTGDLRILALSHPVHHYSYDSADDFLRKMRSYSQLFAAQHAGRKSSSPGKAVRHGLWAFAKSYLLQRGFLQGYEGLIISSYKAQTAFWKYLLLHDANRQA